MARVGNIPAEANSKGGLNESTPLAERTPGPVGPETAGPDRDAETNVFRPATYQVRSGNTRRDR